MSPSVLFFGGILFVWAARNGIVTRFLAALKKSMKQ